ncbi:hypothetical protein [Embleya hyalina]|uniref:hypothetical protein n=1 Tax=Embleya hyalina TaxID=516124 RepID=UPI000F82F044|nr:hypothetical protein [Embleya hyalina]
MPESVGHCGMGVVRRDVDREPGRTVAGLSHPGVATLYDVGEDNTGAEPIPFPVMEFVDGRTPAEALREGPLPIGRSISIAHDASDALVHGHGHGHGVPTSTGGVKVLDFGIAKVLAETTTRLTATGMTVGTPAPTCTRSAR